MRKTLINEYDTKLIMESMEGHFLDFKSIDISPSKLTRTLSAFANADGGELYIGIEDNPRTWRGFEDLEAANAHIQIMEKLFPLGNGFLYEFIHCESNLGFVLKIEVSKSHNICFAQNKIAYLRRSAQNLPQEDDTSLERLKKNKGIASFETELLNIDQSMILDSEILELFLSNVVPSASAETWLRKQQLIRDSKPSVAGTLLFSEEPQAYLPKRSGIKVYRYQSAEEEGERDTLAFDPITIEGCVYNLIKNAVAETVRIIEEVKIMSPKGLISANYPKEALHEIVTNAVIHRDYSIPDDIHIRVFDNRVEIQSPGLLPAHITVENIFTERFARNGIIVRLINKFPDPPNKDVGEGLNTAVEAMRKMRLVPPSIEQKGMNLLVVLRHESLATPEKLIMEYLDSHPFIANKEARSLTNVGSENAMKHVLRRMVEANMLDIVKGETVFDTKYIKKK